MDVKPPEQQTTPNTLRIHPNTAVCRNFGPSQLGKGNIRTTSPQQRALFGPEHKFSFLLNWWFGAESVAECCFGGFPSTPHKNHRFKSPNHQSRPPIRGYLIGVLLKKVDGSRKCSKTKLAISDFTNRIKHLSRDVKIAEQSRWTENRLCVHG